MIQKTLICLSTSGLVLAVMINLANAQEYSVKGVVTSADDGEPLTDQAVNVLLIKLYL